VCRLRLHCAAKNCNGGGSVAQVAKKFPQAIHCLDVARFYFQCALVKLDGGGRFARCTQSGEVVKQRVVRWV
jgi:hypothetical protein